VLGEYPHTQPAADAAEADRDGTWNSGHLTR
jgi:hypothetical protein